MNLADGIRKIGFRRWYERQLIECHLYLITGLLSMVVVGLGLEAFSLRKPGIVLLWILVLTAAGLVACVWSFRRYLKMLVTAQHAASHSVCSKCQTYGRLELLRAGAAPLEPDAEPWVRVRCRGCGHEWVMD